MKLVNRYYTGFKDLLGKKEQSEMPMWARPTLESAIEKARKILETEPERDAVAIVQVTHVVRRANQPIVVEEVDCAVD